MPVADRDARRALITSASLAVAALASAALSAAFLRRYGASAASDGFYAGFGVYLLVVMFAGTLRLVGPAWSTRQGDPTGATLLGVVAPVALVVAVLISGLAPWTSELLASGSAVPVARDALLLLGPAAALQLIGGAQSAALQLHGRYVPPAVAVAAGTTIAPAAFLLLAPHVGVRAMPVAILLGAVVAVATQTAAGCPAPRLGRARVLLDGLVALFTGGAAVLSVSAAYVVSTALLATAPRGTVTVFAYAYYLVSTIYMLTGSSVAFVVTGGGRPAERGYLAPMRAALLGMAPLLAIAATGGVAVVGWIFGLDTQLTGDLRRDVVLLLPWAPATALLALAVATLVARGRTALLLGGLVAVLSLQVVLGLALRAALGVPGPIVALGITPVVAATGAIAAVAPPSAAALLRGLVRALAEFGSAAAFAALGAWLPLVSSFPGDPLWAGVSCALALVLYLAILRLVRPPELAQLRRALRV